MSQSVKESKQLYDEEQKLIDSELRDGENSLSMKEKSSLVEEEGLLESFENEHEAFAASRVSQYVYVPAKDVFYNTLDQHADTLEADVKPPLVLVGSEGSGKSALLANWVAKRREHKHRDEFLFQHFVGCSTQSLQLHDTLFRLETALKVFFQLREMKVPDTEVELRWALNRFLEAASKKHNPARIVIIIDGADRLKAEGAPDGALYWLPTDLPPCVRFVVSTVETERHFRGMKREGTLHRTFVELSRRQCPTLKIEPLGAHTRTNIISEFGVLQKRTEKKVLFELNEAQQFRVMTTAACAQPMYLRTLLQGIKLALSLTTLSLDKLLDKYLACTTAHELIDKSLNVCCQSHFYDNDDDSSIHTEEGLLSDVIGKILSVVYVSRSGLTESEIWGLIKMVNKFEPSPEQSKKLMSILKDFTMVVNDMHSFSHEIYREVIYQKYISSREALIRYHNVLARFFGQLPPCDRKLVALPYHLEMAGSWSKVKNCLTDIEMFQLWWTPKFKSDFIKFWASLTRVGVSGEDSNNNNNNNKKKKDGKKSKDNNNNDNNNSTKPSYDIVEEYVKSLDEYRTLKHPPDETVAGIILEIGDFLLEFATLGHEKNADVPALIHPKVLSEDLKAIGVPYIEIDEEGRSSLVYPDILHVYSNKNKPDDAVGTEGGKAVDDIPECTTYFFNRWMWIQFPYIALGNCDNRYTAGINQKLLEDSNMNTRGKKLSDEMSDQRNTLKKGNKNSLTGSNSNASFSQSVDSMKLPKIKFNRKAAKSVSRAEKVEDELDATNSKVQQRIDSLQDTISNYREEYDFVIQMKSIVARRLQDLKDALSDLQRTAESCNQFDGELEVASKRETEAFNRYEGVKTMNKNLIQLSLMTDRHPANVPALITELQNKVTQDEYILSEIKKRLWEQRFEHQTHMINFRRMKGLVQEAVHMHNSLLEYKYEYKKSLTQQAIDDEKRLLSESKSKSTSDHPRKKLDNSLSVSRQNTSKEVDCNDQAGQTLSWEDAWAIISSRTGIVEPESFFGRIKNGSALIEQINTIKKASEAKLDTMKKEVVTVEEELEEARYQASFAGGQSSKEHVKMLSEKQQELRHVKEKTEATEQLEQKVVAGLAHICEILFIPKSDEETPVIHLVRDIEAVLDTLINEREKQLQQTQTQGKEYSGTMQIPETLNRSPELDFAVSKLGNPTVRLPSRLPSKGTDGVGRIQSGRSNDDEENEEGMWDRSFAKSQSLKSLKMELKKQAKLSKTSTV